MGIPMVIEKRDLYEKDGLWSGTRPLRGRGCGDLGLVSVISGDAICKEAKGSWHNGIRLR